jgi:hypothetical protein
LGLLAGKGKTANQSAPVHGLDNRQRHRRDDQQAADDRRLIGRHASEDRA